MTREEFAALPVEAQNTIRAGLLLHQMMADPTKGADVRAFAEEQAKKANPSYQTTEDIAAPIVAKALAQVDKRLKDRDDKQEAREAELALTRQIEQAKRDGYTDEGIARILKRMTEKGVGDFETALKADMHDHPENGAVPPPGSADRTEWDFYGKGGIEGANEKDFFSGAAANAPSIMENEDAWARSTALGYLNGRITLPG